VVNFATTALFLFFGGSWLADLSHPAWFGFVSLWLFLAMILSAFAVVRHAEALAVRLGEPFGTLILTLAVTGIEVMMIAAIMYAGKGNSALARDAMMAVVMIVLNGMLGVSLILGGLRYREQAYNLQGANAFLAVILPLAVLGLIQPNFTVTTPGPVYSAAQLGFVSVVTVLLYGVFLYTQTILHRNYFVSGAAAHADDGAQASNRMLALSIVLLLVSLLAVVLLAKKFSLVIDFATARIGAPPAFAGVLVALLILLPESVAAVAAARNNDLQKSINLALGSSIATIGLTIPAVAITAYTLDMQLVLGLNDQEIVLLVLTFILSMLTFVTGRTNILFGLVHLVVFAVFVFLVFVP